MKQQRTDRTLKDFPQQLSCTYIQFMRKLNLGQPRTQHDEGQINYAGDFKRCFDK